MQVLGGALFCSGVMTALLAGTIGFELDVFMLLSALLEQACSLYRRHTKKTA